MVVAVVVTIAQATAIGAVSFNHCEPCVLDLLLNQRVQIVEPLRCIARRAADSPYDGQKQTRREIALSCRLEKRSMV